MKSLQSPQDPQRTHSSRAPSRARVDPRNRHLVVDAEKKMLSTKERSSKCNQENRCNQLGLCDDHLLLCVICRCTLGQRQRHVQSGPAAEDSKAAITGSVRGQPPPGQ